MATLINPSLAFAHVTTLVLIAALGIPVSARGRSGAVKLQSSWSDVKDGQQGPILTRMGLNYGRVGDNLAPPEQAVAWMKQLGVGSVRIFDSDAGVLKALANSGLDVIITVKNQDVVGLAGSPQAAAQWVQTNIQPFYPATRIIAVDVANEITIFNDDTATWQQLVPAMRNIQATLTEAGLAGKIMVSTSLAMDIMTNSSPPSAGCFRDDIAEYLIKPLLQFLSDTSSPFFINVYPYYTWLLNQQTIPLEFALFDGTSSPVVDGELTYTNLLDAQLDAIWAAMAKLGFPNLPIVITETGWPTGGGPAASPGLASTFNQRLTDKILANPSQGTPMHPGSFVPTYLFALFNEDLKSNPLEKNWGLLYPNGTRVYIVDLTTEQSTSSPSDDPTTPAPASGMQWCIAKDDSDLSSLQNTLDSICGSNAAFCTLLQDQQPCFNPNTLVAHASFAINSDWQANKGTGATCDFGGIGQITSTNPSHDTCVFTSN